MQSLPSYSNQKSPQKVVNISENAHSLYSLVINSEWKVFLASEKASSWLHAILTKLYFLYIIIIIIFRGLGLLACSGSEFIFWNLWIYWTVGRTPWMGDRPEARPLLTHRTTQHRETQTHIHASSGIQTHDPSVRAVEDSTWLRPLGHWDRLPPYL
jgi:hypothetical protein